MALKQTIENVEQQQLEAEAEQHFRRALVQIYEKYGYDRHAANDAAILDLCDGDKWEVTLANFQFLRDNNQEAIDSRMASKSSLEDQREKVISEIVSLLEGTRERWLLENERKRLRMDTRYDLKWLIGRRDELLRIRETEKKSAAQLKKEIKPPTPGMYPTLPRQMVPHGRVKSVAVDKDFLVNLSRHDLEKFRSMCRLYGSTQINQRLSE